MAGLLDAFRGQPRLNRRWKVDLPDAALCVRWSPDGRRLAAASAAGPIAVLDAATGKGLLTLAGHALGTAAVAWKPDGKLLASAGQDGKARVWDAATGQEAAAVAGGAGWVEHVTWHPTRDLFVSAAGKKMRLWTPAGERVREFSDHPATVADLAWKPGAAELASCSYGGVWLWDVERPEPVRRLEWQGSALRLAWRPGGAFIAHGDQTAEVHYWSLATGEPLGMAGYPAKVRQLAWDPRGRFLATGGGDVITVWDCTPPGPENTTPLQLAGHREALSDLAYQARGAVLASGGLDGKVMLWQPGAFKKSLATSDAGAPVTEVVWSPDDRSLAVGTEAGQVTVYSV